MLKKIELDCYEITITIRDSGGTIYSNLKEKCPYCGQNSCYFYCDQSTYDDTLETEKQTIERRVHNSRIDAIESLVLAHATVGIDVTTPAYIEGIETAVDACANHV